MTTIYQDMQARREAASRVQDAINGDYACSGDKVQARASLAAYAAHTHQQYPQYAGHWDGPEWVLVRISQTIRTKSGVAWWEGDLAIAKRLPGPGGWGGWLAYSIRNGVDTQLGYSVQEL